MGREEMRTALRILALLFLGMATWAGEPKDVGIATYRIPRTSTAPRLDGVLEDACWKEALRIHDFVPLGRGAQPGESPSTEAFLAYDAENLYVAYRCEEPLVDRLRLKVKEHDGPAWNDDCVEIFFNPSGDRARYVQIVINAAGVVMDGYYERPGATMDVAYESGAVAATKIGKGEWTLEVQIPLAGLPITDPFSAWTFHLGRTRAAAGQHLTALRSPISGFHEIGKFDRLEGISLPERPVGVLSASIGELYRGKNIARTSLKNYGHEACKVRVTAGIGGGNQAVRILNPGETANVELGWELGSEISQGRATLSVHLGERLIYHRSVALRTPPELFGELRYRALYMWPHAPVKLSLPIRLAEGSRREAQLRWEAFAQNGERVGDGQTLARDPDVVLRLYWPRWEPDFYTLRFELLLGQQSLGRTERVIRLVETPWGDER